MTKRRMIPPFRQIRAQTCHIPAPGAIGAAPGIIIILVVVIARLTGALESVERMAFDSLLRSRPSEPIDEHLLIVEINEEDIQNIGTYPIPDQELASVITTLQESSPTVIGFDLFRDLPIGDRPDALAEIFETNPTIVGIERVELNESEAIASVQPSAQFGFANPILELVGAELVELEIGTDAIAPPPALPPERVGFVNAVLDEDGYLRRSLLGTYDGEGNFRFSLTIRLAEIYLAQHGQVLENGIQDPQAMRFGDTEIPRFHPNTGGYVNADAGGIQTLLNVRSGRKPFRIVSLTDVEAGRVPEAWIRDRIVLIGVTAMSAGDFVNSAATYSQNPGLNSGVEMQAHAVSQLVNATLDGRPLLRSWGAGWEYLWIIAWGVVGLKVSIMLSSALIKVISVFLSAVASALFNHQPLLQLKGKRWEHLWIIAWGVSGLRFGIEFSSSLRVLMGVFLGTGILVGICYTALILGWWIPLVPSLLVFTLNGTTIAISRFYQHELRLKTQLQERQLILEHIFDTLHNGPLQSIAAMLRQAREDGDDPFLKDLEALNQELRSVYESIRQEVLSENSRFYINRHLSVDLEQPLHEVLYEIYDHTLTRDFPYLQSIKIKVVTFENIEYRDLTTDQKRGLCRFLEEALCNVGKYAKEATLLTVICKSEEGWSYIRVQDNGQDGCPDGARSREGRGTQQAKSLARQLDGRFQRYRIDTGGTCCELRWPIRKPSWLQLFGLPN